MIMLQNVCLLSRHLETSVSRTNGYKEITTTELPLNRLDTRWRCGSGAGERVQGACAAMGRVSSVQTVKEWCLFQEKLAKQNTCKTAVEMGIKWTVM
jgi:hypothetical protein